MILTENHLLTFQQFELNHWLLRFCNLQSYWYLRASTQNIDMKRIFNISHKRRSQDSIKIDGNHYGVGALIKGNPLLLWKAIHTKGSGLSLVRNDYYKLKKEIEIINPLELAKVKLEFEQRKEMKVKQKVKNELLKDIKEGKINTVKSRFKSVKIVEE